MQKIEDIADVLITGLQLKAINEINFKKRWNFVKQGVSENAFYRAYKKYNLLDKRKSARKAFVMYMRGIRLKNKHETHDALKRERLGLLKHLAASFSARKAVAIFLYLPNHNLNTIRQMLEKGTVEEQLVVYGKVVNHLILNKKYNKNYDYYWLGFRFIADKYWLSKSALRILAKVI